MSENLKELKSAAKTISRARRIPHVGALEVVATLLDYPHWNALVAAEKKGWRPSLDQVMAVRGLAWAENPLVAIGIPPEIALGDARPRGEVLGHGYRVSIALDDVRIWGRGWELVLPEAPLAPPRFTNTEPRWQQNPIVDPAFKASVLAIASEWRQKVHARISSDWPRRSTVPDGEGRAQHPISGAVSTIWHCMRCDGASDAYGITANLFHCPHCLANPRHIHSTPWWLGTREDQVGQQ